MKNSLLISLILLICSSFTSYGSHPQNDDWRERMMNEKIAFLTREIGITPEEGQKFWPVYNQINEQREQAMFKVFKAYKELSEGIKKGRPEKEISNLLDIYIAAQNAQKEVETGLAERFKSVIPVEKVARLYIAEENFRRHFIHKFHQKGDSKK